MALEESHDGGYRGRGGRGLAILELVQKQQISGRGGNTLNPAGTITGSRGILGAIGRASIFQLSTQEQRSDCSNNATPAVSNPTQAVGTGNLAAMLQALQSSRQTPFVGRGAAASLLRTTQVTSPAESSKETGSDHVASAFSKMNISDSARKPTVNYKGSGGKRLNLATNYIRLSVKHKNVYQYHVNFEPTVESKSMRIGLLYEHKQLLPVKVFDGTLMFVPDKLLNDETVLSSKRKTDGACITITLKFVKSVPSSECPQLYGILLRRVMSILKLCQVGKYWYNPSTPSIVHQHKLEVWPGYITAIKEHEGGLMLLLDSSHKVLRTQTVLELMGEISQTNPTTFHEEITRKIVGCVVLTRYNNKTYRIDDIEWDKNPTHTFDSNGQQMTFQEYYWKHYSKKVDPTQPLLIHRQKKRELRQGGCEIICLIPELCSLTGLTDDIRSNFTVMKDLSAHTRVTPNQRHLTMKKFVDSVNSNPEASQLLQDWGLQLENSALALEGRHLNIETIFMGDQRKFSAGPQAEWTRDLIHNKAISAVNLENWLIAFVRNNTNEVNNFLQEVVRVGPTFGMVVKHPSRIQLQDDKTETLIRCLRQNVNPKVQLVMVVMSTSREDKYSAIKKFTCVECPVPSQVIVQRTIRNPNKLRSIVQKIVLQINCKLGGELWALKIPLERLMVVGIDSFHDVARGRRSIGGFVSSINPECTRWFSRVCIQMQGEELLPGLKLCMTTAIRKYHEVNHFLPEKIMIFRDGVGDGQLALVSDYEVKQIQSCFRNFGQEYQPKLTVIVVQKRINTRIFLRMNGNNLDNPMPGTVVDHTITRRDMYDYFLVSQHVRQGTVSPTHYIVVHDEICLTPERTQILSYKMTHLYYNWPGTVRVPAPCLYAHKLAYLVGQNIHKEPSEDLSDRLFFL